MRELRGAVILLGPGGGVVLQDGFNRMQSTMQYVVTHPHLHTLVSQGKTPCFLCARPSSVSLYLVVSFGILNPVLLAAPLHIWCEDDMTRKQRGQQISPFCKRDDYS